VSGPVPPRPRGALSGTALGGYQLESLLGDGAMGEVYRARERHTGQHVAVKVLIESKTQNPSVRERFEREWRVMQGISHPNVIALLDWPKHKQGVLYFAMELLDGETLYHRLEREKVPPDVAVTVFEQLAEALAAVHAAGIVHRDVKPQNIFLSEDASGKTRVKLLDFGLARVAGSQITGSGLIVGTPAYVAPEQASGDKVDERVDVYALGLVMYRVLTGQHPFSSDDQVTTLGHQLLSPPPPLSWLDEDVPEALEALVLSMLRKRPEDRPQSMKEVLEALSASKRGESIFPVRLSNPPDDRYGPLNPLAESLVKGALVTKGFRRKIDE
jgi:eukaryotic-like serine/threonine-protein kinase